MEILFIRGIRFGSISTTKNLLESTCLMRCADPRRWKFKLPEKQLHCRSLSCNFVPFFNRISAYRLPLKYKLNKNPVRYYQPKLRKSYVDKNGSPPYQPQEKLSLFGKIKQMSKDYWHILVPIHVVNSLGWVGLFYVIVEKGVDITKILEYFNVSEKYKNMFRSSSAGNWALVYLLYKVATPLRYTMTLGCTTLAIKQLSKSGLVKPLPFGKQSQAMYKTTESNKKTQFKVERQAEPPKT